MFVSGATIPLEVLPEGVRHAARFIPLTHVVTLLRGVWAGEVWGEHLTEVIVLLGVLAVGAIVSAKTFRWE
jgi:ABC-2 type transport system permease protein